VFSLSSWRGFPAQLLPAPGSRRSGLGVTWRGPAALRAGQPTSSPPPGLGACCPPGKRGRETRCQRPDVRGVTWGRLGPWRGCHMSSRRRMNSQNGYWWGVSPPDRDRVGSALAHTPSLRGRPRDPAPSPENTSHVRKPGLPQTPLGGTPA